MTGKYLADAFAPSRQIRCTKERGSEVPSHRRTGSVFDGRQQLGELMSAALSENSNKPAIFAHTRRAGSRPTLSAQI